MTQPMTLGNVLVTGGASGLGAAVVHVDALDLLVAAAFLPLLGPAQAVGRCRRCGRGGSVGRGGLGLCDAGKGKACNGQQRAAEEGGV